MDITEDFMLTPRVELKGKTPLKIMMEMARDDVSRHGREWGFGDQGAVPKSAAEMGAAASARAGGRNGSPAVKARRDEIVRLNALGYTAADIARQLGITKKTVWSDIAIAEGRAPSSKGRRKPEQVQA